ACKGGQRQQLLRPSLFQMGHVNPSFLRGLPSSAQGGRLLRQADWDAARLNTGQPITASTRFSNYATSAVMTVRRDFSAAQAITWLCTDWAMGLVLGRSPFRMETNSSIMPSSPPEWPVLPGWTVYTARFPVITPGPNQVTSITLLSMEARISPLVPINVTVRSQALEKAHMVKDTVTPFSNSRLADWWSTTSL